MTIAQFCDERGITTKELFKLAYVAESGIIYGLESPDKLHATWLRQQCVIPLYVMRFVKKTLERETNQQLVPPI